MNTKCRCGGRLHRSDLIRTTIEHNGVVLDAVKDIGDGIVSRFKCDKCGKETSKMKRRDADQYEVSVAKLNKQKAELLDKVIDLVDVLEPLAIVTLIKYEVSKFKK